MLRYRRYFIALAIVVVLLGGYAALGFLAVPHLARSAATDFVRQHYGRTLGLGEIRFNPFTLTLDITRASLPDADGAAMLAFDRLRVDLQYRSLWRRGPSFREIRLEAPYVRAVLRRNGDLNLADLGKGFPPEPPGRPARQSAPLRLFIQQLAVTAGAAVFEDRSRAAAFTAQLKPITFDLRDFSTLAGSNNAYALTAVSARQERFNWHGTLRLTPLSSHGEFEIADLRASTIASYLGDSLPVELTSGAIALRGDYDLVSGAGPLSLNLNVRHTAVTRLGVRPRNTDRDYLRVARIDVGDTRLDLGRHSVEVGAVQIDGGEIQAWLDEHGHLNLQDLARAPAGTGAAAPSASEPAAAPTAGAAAAWKVSVPDIRVSRFKVAAEDRQVKPAVALSFEPIEVHVTGFNTAPNDSVDLTVDTGVNSAGKLAIHASATPHTGAVTAGVEASALPLPVIQPYLARYTSMTLLSGRLGTKLKVDRRADGAVDIAGNTRIEDLRTVDNALRQDFIKWTDLYISEARYRSAPASLRIASITVREPYLRMIIAPDRSVNISKVLSAPGKAASSAPEAGRQTPTPSQTGAHTPKVPPALATRPAAGGSSGSGAAMPVAIGMVRVVNGSANYSDLWIKPSFSVGIQSLGGKITGLSSDPGSRARVALEGKVDRYSPVKIAGEMNLLSAALYTDITMGFKDLDLTIVNPYSGHFAGYKIDKGKLSVDVTYKLDQRRLDAKQHFIVDQLQLGERVESPDAVHLPLKIAVALLKDRNGVIDLNLPMSGTLDDPSFRIGPILWKMFVNLIVKAATAPFALLGHLFGGGEHVNLVDFAPGSSELSQPAQEQLASLVKALKERPQLKLDVPIVWSPADGAALAAAHLQQRLLERAAGGGAGNKRSAQQAASALDDPERHCALLLEEFRAQLGKDTPLPASAAAVAAAKRKESPPYDAAIDELTRALVQHGQVPDSDLEALGKQRAQAIQDALLSGGAVDPGRVFIVNAAQKPQSADQVRVELAVK